MDVMVYLLYLMLSTTPMMAVSKPCKCSNSRVDQVPQTTTPEDLCTGVDCSLEGPNIDCFAGICLCSLGFHLNNTDCVRECGNGNYGETYIQYPNGIDGTCGIAIETTNQTSIATCQKQCTDNSQCLSFIFNAADGSCITNFCDPLDDIDYVVSRLEEIPTTIVADTITLGVRNCDPGR